MTASYWKVARWTGLLGGRMLKRYIWVISFLGIAFGAVVDILNIVVEILEEKENERPINRGRRRK